LSSGKEKLLVRRQPLKKLAPCPGNLPHVFAEPITETANPIGHFG